MLITWLTGIVQVIVSLSDFKDENPCFSFFTWKVISPGLWDEHVDFRLESYM